MYRIRQLLLLTFVACLISGTAYGVDTDPNGKPLLRIDDTSYTDVDFRNWWKNWQDPGATVPETLDPYIEWLLLSREARDMELHQMASYRRKVWVFLKSRSLLMLKNEAIDAKISITEEDLKAPYSERYLPRNEVEILYFNDPALAGTAYLALSSGTLTMEDFKKRAAGGSEEYRYQEQTIRPHTSEKSWLDTVKDMKEGDIAAPFAWSEGYVLLRLSSRKGFSREDFEKFRDKLHTELWKKQQYALTSSLVEELKKTYQVKVNEELLDGIDPDAPLDTFTDKKIVTTTRESYSERQFAEMIQKEVAKRRSFLEHAPSNAARPIEEDISEMKHRIVRNVLAQQLTTWAALDRHYEQEEPFKSIFDFYTGHRLIKELNRRVFQPGVIPSQEEIAAYYQENKKEFTRPDSVDIELFVGDEEQARRVWTTTTLGADFSVAAKKFDPHGVKTISFSVPDLDPEMVKATKDLAPDELSPVFTYKGSSAVVKLIARHYGETMPLEDATGRISEMLRRMKMKKIRIEFLDKLKKGSSIEINDSAWTALRRDLVG